MLKNLITSVTGRLLIILVTVDLVCAVLTPIFHWPAQVPILTNATLIVFSGTIWWQNNKWCVRVLSWFFPGKYFVELIDWTGERFWTLATMQDGRWQAPVYFSTNIGHVILNDDGTVDRNSESSYIYYWLPMNKTKRVIHILSNNIPV